MMNSIKLNKTGLVIFLLIVSYSCFSQTRDSFYALFDERTILNEGIYTSIKDIQTNQPSIKTSFIKKGGQVFYKNEQDSLVELSPNTVYGYSYNNKIYLSSEGAFWRCVNVGRLTQFSEVKVNSYIDYDPYTNSTLQRNVSILRHNFLDMHTGEFKRLSYNNLKPYIEEEPNLKKYVKKNNKAKYKELILILKAYNQLNPLYTADYE